MTMAVIVAIGKELAVCNRGYSYVGDLFPILTLADGSVYNEFIIEFHPL